VNNGGGGFLVFRTREFPRRRFCLCGFQPPKQSTPLAEKMSLVVFKL
jgi:hypothetical protein